MNTNMAGVRWFLKHLYVGKIFEGVMLNRILQTTLLQIFCEIIFNSDVIAKCILDAGDNF